MRITCPHCGERALTRTSKRPLPTFYEVFAQCTNPHCGWGGKFLVEAVLTYSPSLAPDADVSIPMAAPARQALLAQLND
ncbi:ogr/Delta-like zinc finger family protein [Chromohalobacter israelensis]|uniref:ogr/Delta-like zinc finger family protein n=1 Tax=Chromohalobacter israelensis TaxID=141390 RepID=UPI001CC6730A|nr:ogr/Delta-like zinc finger family protein [Chromohalobacter salexigens]MBZ5875988.1 ogr/Delta-like zinc finger family protein [Chromohalobacter salexigens]